MSLKKRFLLFLFIILIIFTTINLSAYFYISSRLFKSGKIDTYMISASIISELIIERGDKECYQILRDRRYFEYMPAIIARIYKDNSFDYICGTTNDLNLLKYALSRLKGEYTFFTYGTEYIALIRNTDTTPPMRHLIIFPFEKDTKNYQKLQISILVFNFILLIILGIVIYLLIRRLYFKPFESLKERLTSLELNDTLADDIKTRDETALIISSVASLIRNLKNEKEQLIMANEALKKAQDDLIKSERLSTVGKIAASIAHEVGTPLGTIRGYIDIIQKSLKESRTQNIYEFLQKMDNEILRISNILRELLDYARPPKFNITSGELNSVIDEVTHFLSMQKAFRDIRIKKDYEKKVIARFDKDRMKQILINLIINAKDAMNGVGEIVIRVDEDQNYAFLSVKDSGCGIKDSDKDKIFEPFFTTKPSGQGSGLGLAIVKRLVESMDGRIEFTTEINKGTTFTIFLKKATNE